MTMAVTQVRLPNGLVDQMDTLVESGLYTSKSDVIRDALRRLLLEKHVGSIPNKGDSVQEIKAIRSKLDNCDIEEINKLGE